MRDILNWLGDLPFWVWLIVPIVVAIVLFRPLLRLLGVVIVPEHSIGLVNKVFALFGEHKALPDGSIIALKGEAGNQADPLPPGLYFGYFPWQYRITLQRFIAHSRGPCRHRRGQGRRADPRRPRARPPRRMRDASRMRAGS